MRAARTQSINLTPAGPATEDVHKMTECLRKQLPSHKNYTKFEAISYRNEVSLGALKIHIKIQTSDNSYVHVVAVRALGDPINAVKLEKLEEGHTATDVID